MVYTQLEVYWCIEQLHTKKTLTYNRWPFPNILCQILQILGNKNTMCFFMFGRNFAYNLKNVCLEFTNWCKVGE